MNFNNFDKMFKDTMSLFNSFGSLANSGQSGRAPLGRGPYDQISSNFYQMGQGPYNNLYGYRPYANNQESQINPQDIKPSLPGANSSNLKNRDIKRTNEYYLEKIKNFLNKEY